MAVVSIVEARCTYLQSPGFGYIKSSVLVVRGWTVPCRMKRKDEWKVDFWHFQDGNWMLYVPKVQGDFMFFEDCDDTGYQTFHRGEELCLVEVSRGRRTGMRGLWDPALNYTYPKPKKITQSQSKTNAGKSKFIP